MNVRGWIGGGRFSALMVVILGCNVMAATTSYAASVAATSTWHAFNPADTPDGTADCNFPAAPATIDRSTGMMNGAPFPTGVVVVVRSTPQGDVREVHCADIFVPATGTVVVAGSMPLELYAAGTATIAGVLDADGDHASSSPGAAGPGGSGGGVSGVNRSGGGGGGLGAGQGGPYSSSSQVSGGAPGGAGSEAGAGDSTGPVFTGGGGGAGYNYGTALLEPDLRGGSGGGGGGGGASGGGAGGGGGGALRLIAETALVIDGGQVTARGGRGGDPPSGGARGGGGSGGAIYLNAPTVSLRNTLISTAGGWIFGSAPTPSVDGEGGTGRLAVVTDALTMTGATLIPSIPAPPNDNFSSPTALQDAGGTVTGTNFGATGEAEEPNHASVSDPINSVWYRWTALESGAATIDLCGASFDSTLAVYTGDSFASLTEVATDDGSCTGSGSSVTFPTAAATMYRIAVDGSGPVTGSFELHYAVVPTCPGFASDPRNQIVGTAASETLTGTTGADIICGLGGNDRLEGGGSDDVLLGGNGADALSGSGGADRADGGAGKDSLKGGGGADTIIGGASGDTATYGGSPTGVNVDISVSPGSGSGGDAQGDSLTGIENLWGTGFVDSLTGSTTANTIRGFGGGDTLKGLGGTDTLDYTSSTAGVTIDLRTSPATVSGGHAAGDVVSLFERVIGSSFEDVLHGNNLANWLTGASGNDSLFGYGGNDRLLGQAGTDSFDGGPGTDFCDEVAGESHVNCE